MVYEFYHLTCFHKSSILHVLHGPNYSFEESYFKQPEKIMWNIKKTL